MKTTLRTASRWVPALALALLAVGAPAHAERAPARSTALQANAEPGRVIVKFRTGLADARRTAQSTSVGRAPAWVGMSADEVKQVAQQRAQNLGNRHGLVLQAGRAIDDHLQVVMAQGIDSRALVARLSGDAEVERVVVDGRRFALRVPNDSYYAAGPAVVGSSGGPAVGQWYLRAPEASTPVNGDESKIVSSINAPAAWDITTGHRTVPVAVLDTGIRAEHPDLAGKVLAGYDMIHDATTANDGNGRDSDASDPGDWITDADKTNATFKDCTVENSSWHGTQTAGLIGAATNNGTGMAGGAWNATIVPVRVLGKCGGYDSDIAAGMLWAAGLPVAGVPANANPVKVMNLSLGGSGYPAELCSNTAYKDVVPQVLAQGAVIVASAGNGLDDGGHALNPPANCSGVIAVAGLRHAGTKVGYSDLGPDVSIAAPAGNCVNTSSSQPCIYPIMSLTNRGTTSPTTSAYTDSFDAGIGTSFSAPLVSATAALMMTANPTLTPNQVLAAIQNTARPFPSSGAAPETSGPVPVCQAPSQTGQLQCYCTKTTCGAGMLDMGAAVASIATQLVAYIDVSPASPVPGAAITLGSGSTVVPSGRTIASAAWSLVSDGGIVPPLTTTSGSTITVTPTAAGQFTVRLTVIDSTGATASADQVVTVAAATPTPPPNNTSTGSGGGAMSVAWLGALTAATLLLWAVRAAQQRRSAVRERVSRLRKS